jgi:hypothetical protein
MNTYTIPLNFDLPLFKTNLSPVDFFKSHPVWQNDVKMNFRITTRFTLNAKIDLTKEINEFFLDHGQEIIWSEIFYKSSNMESKIHNDTKSLGDYSKIIWVFNGEDSKMNWYNIKDFHDANIKDNQVVHTSMGSKVIEYEPEEVDLVYSENVRGPSIIQVGIPHNIKTGNQDRWAFGISFVDYKLDRRPTFLEAKEIFKQYLV